MGEDPRTRDRPRPRPKKKNRPTDDPKRRCEKANARTPNKDGSISWKKEKFYGDAGQRRFFIARTEIIPFFRAHGRDLRSFLGNAQTIFKTPAQKSRLDNTSIRTNLQVPWTWDTRSANDNFTVEPFRDPRAVYANETRSVMGEDPRTRDRPGPPPKKRSTDRRLETTVRKSAPRRKTDLHLEKKRKPTTIPRSEHEDFFHRPHRNNPHFALASSCDTLNC